MLLKSTKVILTSRYIFEVNVLILIVLLTGLVCQKPNYEIGSASKLSFAKSASVKASIDAAWKIDNTDEEIVNADELLDENDKEKPDPSSLKGRDRGKPNKIFTLIATWNSCIVCGTTGKRKACKDCSCGLAEELSKENQAENPNTNNVKSSCGSVRLNFKYIYS